MPHRKGVFLGLLFLTPLLGWAQESVGTGGAALLPWWAWAAILFVFALGLGIVAVLAGVGGGVLFVPIVNALFPFHLDFVRGAGLMVALFGALAAAPTLLRRGLASIRMALPLALFGSVGSILGALVGLAVPVHIVQVMLGVAILSIVVLMVLARRSEVPERRPADRLSQALGITGVYHEPSEGTDVEWNTRRLPLGLVAFVGIGFLGGMFGIGAGWANVPALNLLLGAPLKIAVATSGFIVTVNGTAATWVYIHSAAVLPLIAVPSVAGMMIGTRIGAGLLPGVRPKVIRWIVIGILSLSGLRSLLAGLGVM